MEEEPRFVCTLHNYYENDLFFFLMIGICVNWQCHKGQGEKEQLQSWVLIILLFKFAVELVLIVFNHSFQPSQEWGNSLSLFPGLGFPCSRAALRSPEFGFSLISYFIHIILQDAVQKKEDFMQIKGWGGENPNFWLWELPGFPCGDREVKRSRKGKSKAGKALEGIFHPSLPSGAAPPTPG